MSKAIESLTVLNTRVSKAAKVKRDLATRVTDINNSLKSFSKTLLTCSQICEALNISEPTLIKYRNKGLVPYVKLGKSFFYVHLEGVFYE